ncbi:Non-specific serine/threonine protein kinase [Handroanthus impetiginosus]|uniref:Non-specific serine/threonine protein kinase n=1 Tax=Handroanthus impetiginosus TaxID=429701 RepID=A0A2G9HNE3_9LAMI|nr:Non-specific serine/threonine protein kinase [Handroanthus impetiginosus]
MIIGKGGYRSNGTAHEGVLQNTNIVATKKSKEVDPSQIQQFINELIILSQVHHMNIVRLLGWEKHLKMAAETAGIVSYLHSAVSTPTIHRDIKSANILLDALFTAKVSDFGASRLVPLDRAQLSTIV